MKLGTKIIGIFLGAALAAGVSTAAVLQINKRNIKPAKAETASFDFTNCGYFAYGASVLSYTSDNLYIFQGNVSGSNNPAASAATSPKFFADSLVTFRPAPGVSIQNVTIVGASATYAGYIKNATYTNATATINSTTVTITPNGDGDFSLVTSSTANISSINYSYTGSALNNAYQLVTDANQLTYGTKVVLATTGELNSVTYNGALVPIPNNNNAGNPSMPIISLSDGFNENSILTSKYATEFTLGGHPGAWEFVNGSYKLSFANSINGTIKFTDNPAEGSNYQFNIASPNSGTNILISGLDSFSSRYLRANTYTSSSNTAQVFTANTASGVLPVYMFAQIAEPSSSATAYVNSFMGGLSTGDSPVCSADGNTDLDLLKTAWVAYKLTFDNLEQSDKDQFTYGYADENGNNFQKALALYDYIASKYGTSLESENCPNYNFMGRSSAVHNAHMVNPINNSSQLILIAVISSVICISSIGLFFLIRKRKEQ